LARKDGATYDSAIVLGLIVCAECDIIQHTDDLDLFVPVDYIVSAAHYMLLVVCIE
jgi:hypothetical protein